MDLTQKHQDPIGQLEAQYFALRDIVEPLVDRQKRSELDQSRTAEKYQKTFSHLEEISSVLDTRLETLEETWDRRRATPSNDECRHTHDVNQHEIDELRKKVNGLKLYGDSLKQDFMKIVKEISLDLNQIKADLNQQGTEILEIKRDIGEHTDGTKEGLFATDTRISELEERVDAVEACQTSTSLYVPREHRTLDQEMKSAGEEALDTMGEDNYSESKDVRKAASVVEHAAQVVPIYFDSNVAGDIQITSEIESIPNSSEDVELYPVETYLEESAPAPLYDPTVELPDALMCEPIAHFKGKTPSTYFVGQHENVTVIGDLARHPHSTPPDGSEHNMAPFKSWGQNLMRILVLDFVLLVINILITSRKLINGAHCSAIITLMSLLCLVIFVSGYLQMVFWLFVICLVLKLTHLAMGYSVKSSSSRLQKTCWVLLVVTILFTLCNYPFIGQAVVDSYWDNLPSNIRRRLRYEWGTSIYIYG